VLMTAAAGGASHSGQDEAHCTASSLLRACAPATARSSAVPVKGFQDHLVDSSLQSLTVSALQPTLALDPYLKACAVLTTTCVTLSFGCTGPMLPALSRARVNLAALQTRRPLLRLDASRLYDGGHAQTTQPLRTCPACPTYSAEQWSCVHGTGVQTRTHNGFATQRRRQPNQLLDRHAVTGLWRSDKHTIARAPNLPLLRCARHRGASRDDLGAQRRLQSLAPLCGM
jgi:hypothetical protein